MWVGSEQRLKRRASGQNFNTVKALGEIQHSGEKERKWTSKSPNPTEMSQCSQYKLELHIL